jgi:hypothetical protein
MQTKREWYERHDCTHAHCPHDCEHPQPILDGAELLCLRCLTFEGRRTPMIPCTSETCT